MPDGLRLALTTLTVLPVRGPATLDRRTAGRAMAWAPAVGLALALVAATVVHGARVAGSGATLAAVLGVTTLAVLTRGLHLDGLVDLVDGLASYRDPEATRAVMKGPEVGALGVVAVVLDLMLQVAALARCLTHHVGTACLLLAVVTGRVAVTAACRGVPAATGTGLGALVAGTVRRGVTTAWVLGAVGGLSALGAADTDADSPGLRRLVVFAVAGLTGLLAARLVRGHAVRRVGGITGDVLGALSELTTTLVLVVLALAL